MNPKTCLTPCGLRLLAPVRLGCFALVLGAGLEPGARGAFTTLDYPGAISTSAVGVSGGTVLGQYTDAAGAKHGFLYNGSTWSTLDNPYASGADTLFLGISGKTVVGTYFIGLGSGYGFRYDGTSFQKWNCPLGYSTWACGVSGSRIVGTVNYDSPHAWGFLYDGATYTPFSYPGSWRTEAYGISGNSIAGCYYDSSTTGSGQHGFLLQGSTYISLDAPLGTGGTVALGVSDGLVVGYYRTGSPTCFAYVFDGAGYTTLEMPSGTTFSTANGIDGMTVVGSYTDGSGTHGFITLVPEPAAITLLGLGALCRALLRKPR
jgi:hypothetical protein